MEQLGKIKLNNAPHIKNLFFADSKKSAYYMVIADGNTNVQKGTKIFIKVSGNQWEPATTMSEWQRNNKFNRFSRHKKDQLIFSVWPTTKKNK